MAATRIILSDEVAVTVTGSSLDDIQSSIYEALQSGGWMVIRPDDGRAKSINPRQILYLEELSPAEEAASNGSDPQESRSRQREAEPAAGGR